MNPDDLLRVERDYLRSWLKAWLIAARIRQCDPPEDAEAWADGIVEERLAGIRSRREKEGGE